MKATTCTVITLAAASAYNFVPGDSPLLVYSGRTLSDPAARTTRFDWPAVSIAVAIQVQDDGGSISATIAETGTNRYALSADGGATWLAETLNTTLGTHTYGLWGPLAAGTYNLQLLKLTEACTKVNGCPWGDFGVATVVGLWLEPGMKALPPAAEGRWFGGGRVLGAAADEDGCADGRRLEFVGDSITSGWGARASAEAADDAACNAGEDARASWAHATARQLRAESHVIAWGGVGLVQNDDAGTAPDGSPAPALWQRTIANEPESAWDTSQWLPHAILIHLGTNDLCCDQPVANATFEEAYVAFATELGRSKGGSVAAPAFLLACGPMGNSEGNKDHTGREGYFPCSLVERVAAAVNASGWAAHVLDFSGLMDETENVGGCRHPSERAHAMMAEKAAQTIRDVLGWS